MANLTALYYNLRVSIHNRIIATGGRASDVLTSVAMPDAIKRSDERSFAVVRGKWRESYKIFHVAQYTILETLLIKKCPSSEER